MDALTIIRKLAVRTALLLGILVVVTLVINLSWFDEELHPDLQRLVPPRNVSMDGNAYPWIYGFPSADDRDFRQSGLDIVAALRQRFAAGEQVTLTAEETDRILGSGNDSETLGRQFPALACNARFELDCADRLLADIAESARFDSRLLLLLSRYETILGASRFEENQEFDAYTPLPDYRLLMEISRIRLAASLGGEPVPFIADVQRDIAFWKLMLRDGQSLVAKMVALAGIRNDLTFLSALMRRQPLDDSALEAIGAAVAPLDDAQRDIGETFLAEMRISLLSSKSLGVLLEGPSWIHVLAMQPQATMNEYYVNMTVPLRLRASLSAREFYLQRGYEPLSYDVRAFPPPLYNLGGKFVLKWMASEMSVQDYIARVHDLNGRIALVALQAEIRMNASVPAGDVVRASMHRNPYTLEPMDYDPEVGTLGFECLANASDQCAVLIGGHAARFGTTQLPARVARIR